METLEILSIGKGQAKITTEIQMIEYGCTTFNLDACDVVRFNEPNDYYKTVDEAKQSLINEVLEHWKYALECYENGSVIECFSDIDKANEALEALESEDKENGEYTDGYYSVRNLITQEVEIRNI